MTLPDAAAPVNRPGFEDLVGVRSSKGRYYREYRHSAHDLERTLRAVNAVSRVLAEAAADAGYLADSTLPVIAQLLAARAVVLVSPHPGLGGVRSWERAAEAGEPAVGDLVDSLVETGAALASDCPSSGALRPAPELSCTLLAAPLPHSGGAGHVVAAVPFEAGADGADLAILGTLTNQLGGAIESCRRLSESEQRNGQLRRARHQLVAAREGQVLAEERQRIARDLHDSVAQHVLSMGMQVEWCRTSSDQPDVVERLAEVKELARSTVDRIRQAIFALSGHDEVMPQGLGPALRSLADQHRGFGLEVRVRITGDLGALPVGVQRALYMVVKESLFNTLLHAEAQRAWVSVACRTGEVRLQVSDDGHGRAAELLRALERARLGPADGYHRGLANIAERVRLVHGTLRISDAPRRGVRLLALVPLAAEAAW